MHVGASKLLMTEMRPLIDETIDRISVELEESSGSSASAISETCHPKIWKNNYDVTIDEFYIILVQIF